MMRGIAADELIPPVPGHGTETRSFHLHHGAVEVGDEDPLGRLPQDLVGEPELVVGLFQLPRPLRHPGLQGLVQLPDLPVGPRRCSVSSSGSCGPDARSRPPSPAPRPAAPRPRHRPAPGRTIPASPTISPGAPRSSGRSRGWTRRMMMAVTSALSRQMSKLRVEPGAIDVTVRRHADPARHCRRRCPRRTARATIVSLSLILTAARAAFHVETKRFPVPVPEQRLDPGPGRRKTGSGIRFIVKLTSRIFFHVVADGSRHEGPRTGAPRSARPSCRSG